jgi:hypothetical protein
MRRLITISMSDKMFNLDFSIEFIRRKILISLRVMGLWEICGTLFMFAANRDVALGVSQGRHHGRIRDPLPAQRTGREPVHR